MRIYNSGCAILKVESCRNCPKHKAEYKRERDLKTGNYFQKLVDVLCLNGHFSVFTAFLGFAVDERCKLPVEE